MAAKARTSPTKLTTPRAHATGVARFLVYFFTNLSMANVIYGSLATAVVTLLYLEIASIILLLGAQVIAELEASAAAGLPWYERP